MKTIQKQVVDLRIENKVVILSIVNKNMYDGL